MSNDVETIQRALKGKGFDPGDVDGVWGRRTIVAVRAFQQQAGLDVDGIVGPKVLAALFGGGGQAGPAAPIVWFEEARRLMGLKEDVGAGSNPEILKFARDLDIDYASDDIPWCGLFVAHCIGATLPGEVLPRSPLFARGWKSCGRATTPRLGAVMVFWRGKRDGVQGHVAFYAGEDDHAYRVLGGNQSDSVSVTRIAKDRLIEARWPATAAEIDSKPLRVAANGSALSTNEA